MKKLMVGNVKHSVIIVAFNHHRNLERCLRSVMQSNLESYEVLIFNNGVPKINEVIKKFTCLPIRVFSSLENIGHTKAVNKLIKEAYGKYIVKIDDDAFFDSSCIKKLVSELKKNENYGAVQPLILNSEDSEPQVLGQKMDLWGYDHVIKDYKKITRYASFPAGATFAAKRDVLTSASIENEIYDADFFACYEDNDLGWRILMSGYLCGVVSSAISYHNSRRSRISNAHVYRVTRNRLNSLIKNYALNNLLKYGIQLFFLELFRSIVTAVKSPLHSWEICKALSWNIRHLKSTLIKRRKIQNTIRKVQDDIIITYMARVSILHLFSVYSKRYLLRNIKMR